MHKDYQRQIQVTMTKIQTTVNRMLNTKYAALSLTEASIQKTIVERQNLQISSWAEIQDS